MKILIIILSLGLVIPLGSAVTVESPLILSTSTTTQFIEQPSQFFNQDRLSDTLQTSNGWFVPPLVSLEQSVFPDIPQKTAPSENLSISATSSEGYSDPDIFRIPLNSNWQNALLPTLVHDPPWILWMMFDNSTWHEIPVQERIDESQAIEIIKNRFPELKEYPSNGLPPKSIRTEKSDDGWYVAFVQEGSGRPIISAKCYFVDNTKNITSTGTYTPDIGDDSPEFFSAKTCSAKTCSPGACQLETCHGLDISCGSNPPDVCTEIYMVGDKCLQYAQCGVRNGTCGPVENASFDQCKSCVQVCMDKNKDDSQKLFECESRC